MEQMREQEAVLKGEKFRPAIEPPYRWRDWAAKEDGITGDTLISFINHEETVRPDKTTARGCLPTSVACKVPTGETGGT